MGTVGCDKQEQMSELVARTGRHQQRYEGGCRLVAGCIPFRYRNSTETGDAQSEKVVEVLMINSNSGPGLLFPKGGWENDETVEEAARREAMEEAGVKGDILVSGSILLNSGTKPTVKSWSLGCLGYYNFKSKTLQDELSPEGLCKAAMFALLVKEELQSWPEKATRHRRWLTIPEALENCRHPWMRLALEQGFINWHANSYPNRDNKDDKH